jgi:ABC-2 type transport system ATP-binding protein
MQEVQALCRRVVVINQGKIVADDNLDGLLAGRQTPEVVVEFEGGVTEEQLRALAGVDHVKQLEGYKFSIRPRDGVDLRPELFRFAADHSLSLIGLKQGENSLENVFRELTTPSSDTALEN